jgi:hypothetical protein
VTEYAEEERRIIQKQNAVSQRGGEFKHSHYYQKWILTLRRTKTVNFTCFFTQFWSDFHLKMSENHSEMTEKYLKSMSEFSDTFLLYPLILFTHSQVIFSHFPVIFTDFGVTFSLSFHLFWSDFQSLSSDFHSFILTSKLRKKHCITSHWSYLISYLILSLIFISFVILSLIFILSLILSLILIFLHLIICSDQELNSGPRDSGIWTAS